MADGDEGDFGHADDLVTRAKAGDPIARTQLFDRDRKIAVGTTILDFDERWGMCQLLVHELGTSVKGLTEIESLAIHFAGEAFMLAVNRYDAAKGTKFSSFWVTTIQYMVKEELDRLKKRPETVELTSPHQDLYEESLIPDDESEETTHEVRSALAALPERERVALALVDIWYADEPNPLQRAADDLDLPYAELRRLVRAARRHFRKVWDARPPRD